MNYKLEIINRNMGRDVYDMYQNIPKQELGTTNDINGCSFEEFKKILKKMKKEEIETNSKLNTTTNRYIFYVNDVPVGEVGIRTTLNDFWMNRGSQIFYKIRINERKKGYGTKMLELALKECSKLGMKRVRINCDDRNIASIKIIQKNGGIVDIRSYKTSIGNSSSSSYTIDLISDMSE